jgi:hypothetical protein
MEMGFEREKVAQALNAHQWQEEVALNFLLGMPTDSAQAGAPHHQVAPPKPAKNGLFSGLWGKK